MTEPKKQKAGFWALFAKLGGKALSLFTKLFKLTKVGFAVASFAGYAVLYSWKFAILLMLAIGWHESGHVWAMKRMGIKTKGFYFLPFIGGAAIAEDKYKTYGENAYIAIMGPIWGMLLAYVAVAMYYVTGQPLWAAAGAWMATLNLFNLLPITPLDGGQLMRSIAFSIHRNLGAIFLFISLVLAGIVLWKLHAMLFVIILVIGALELVFELRARIKLHQYETGQIQRWELPKSILDNEGKIKYYPDAMNKKKLALTIISYAGTITLLFAILLLLKNVPGADLASNFFD